LNGSGCTNIFALSRFNVIPAHQANYFLAAAACRNSGKRLPSNAEWQAAALGTPDPWPQTNKADQCNLDSSAVALTGSHKSCVSDVHASDMVGNVIEFVADWGPLATTGNNWDVLLPGFDGGGDVSNMGGPPNGIAYGLPGATIRGGSFNKPPGGSGGIGKLAGVYAIDQNGSPHSSGDGSAAGFRCATNFPGK
jgi:formylglycine-generating enzyme required for sulfatase activity